MPLVIPKTTQFTIKRGNQGTPVWAVQRALNKTGLPTGEDGDFGPITEGNVKKLQTRLGVDADGVVGPETQITLAMYLCERQENLSGTPENLLISKVRYESAGYLAAVNWNSPGGVDCGITQRRIYDNQYQDESVIKRAFDAAYQLDLSGDRVMELFQIFLSRAGVKSNRELAFRLAVLNHNWPVAADHISRVGVQGVSDSYKQPAEWVKRHNLRFPDGHAITTPLEWAQRYALGNKLHNEPGQAVKQVVSWV